MTFQAPITIKTALERMHRRDYVLPAIQREFVWGQDRIIRLFDSLMRGYPIGSFLFWKIEEARSGEFVYYDFIREFHRRDRKHCERLPGVVDRPVTAILDGQQRLTALNVALAGSFAEKVPRLWRNNPRAYPKTELHLDLTHEPDDDEDLQHRFEFLTAEQAEGSHAGWFRVKDIMPMSGGRDLMNWLTENELGNDRLAPENLFSLHEAVHVKATINYYEETEQDIDRVLDIFVRVNSAGMVLSHSDLFLSIAVAQWTEIDAREAIHQLVDDLNSTHHGFNFSKDLVLKTGLVLTDAPDIRFRAQNFDRENMSRLEGQWHSVANALMTATRLLARFGFSGRTLPSNSTLIPIADWIHRHDIGGGIVDSPTWAEERERIRSWILRSQLKAGVFGSGLDTLLNRLRRAIRQGNGSVFPVDLLEQEMAGLGKAPRFEREELDHLVELAFGDARVFVLLALLYPGINVTGDYHIDHIYPRALFHKRHLRQAGVPEDEMPDYRERMDLLPNLQLLEGPENQSKQDRLPATWLEEQISDPAQREEFRARHDLHELGEGMLDFPAFYEARRQRLEAKLHDLLGEGVSGDKWSQAG